MYVCPACHVTFPEGRFCPKDGNALGYARGNTAPVHVPGLTIERELGRGLTGVVWMARTDDGRAVALKVLHREWADHGEMRERFLREARAAAQVAHPCVVAPIAIGDPEDGRPYIVMELVDGPSLEDVLALGPLAEARAATIGSDLASALAAVHRAGVVHRDVKPGNVKIGSDGRARLLDFGVARQLDAEEARLTQGGLAVGTPHYMAPEQCIGEAVTGQADVYALGCVLYRMLSGVVPFDGTGVAVMLAHASREPVDLQKRAPGISPALAALVMRCLAKQPGARPDAAELAQRLHRIAPVNPRASTAFPMAASVIAPAPLPVAAPASRSVHVRLPPADDPGSTRDLLRKIRRRPVLRTLGLLVLLFAALAVFVDSPSGHRAAAKVGVEVPYTLPYLHGARVALIAPPPTVPPPPPEALAADRRFLVASDDGISLRFGTPTHVTTGVELELTIEAWDADGEPLDTADLVVTFAGPQGALLGLAADPTRERGLYRVRTRFDATGDWTVRIFPPHEDAMVTFHLDVGATISAN
jgi:serine/threonine-protein kinase